MVGLGAHLFLYTLSRYVSRTLRYNIIVYTLLFLPRFYIISK